MEKREGIDEATGRWETFALGALAPLGPMSQVHLAPRLPPASLNAALRAYLTLQGDELLLALIDAGAGTPEGCCALTTRRIYWSARDADDLSGPAPVASGTAVTTGRALRAGARPSAQLRRRYYVLDYAELPAAVTVSPAPGGGSLLDLGGGRALRLPGADPALPWALARYLEAMGAAARAGAAPSLREIDPQLADRVARVLPAVAQVTAQTRAYYRDLSEFRRALFAATPRIAVTPFMVLACAAVYLAMVASGVGALLPSTAQLIAWGANAGTRVVLRQEFWRLLTSVFVHGGLVHLAVNMWCLINIGPLVERLYGNLAFAVVYVAAGIGGAVASLAVSPLRVSVGASGAIFGVLGALLAFLIIHRRSIPASLLKPLRASAVGFVVFNTIFGLVVPNIDQAAHMGGLAAGFLSGVLLCPPWPVARTWKLALRRASMATFIACTVAAAGFAAARRSGTAIPPLVRFQDIVEQMTPAYEEWEAICWSFPDMPRLQARGLDPLARRRSLETAQALAERAQKNLARLRRLWTPDPELRLLVARLVRAQADVLNRLQAARDYLQSGRPDALAILGEPSAREVEAEQARRDVFKLRDDYLSKHGVVADRARARPALTRP